MMKGAIMIRGIAWYNAIISGRILSWTLESRSIGIASRIAMDAIGGSRSDDIRRGVCGVADNAVDIPLSELVQAIGRDITGDRQ